MLACTATATPYVRDEILTRLGLPADTPQLVRGFARPNLALRVEEVETAAQRRRIVDNTLAETLIQPGAERGCAIVYGPTRKSTEAERDRLVARGWRCESYHAGLAPEQRDAVHEQFARRDLEVIVATNAFGMGIDRADVRAVIHLAPPGSIEAYYQEVGRAGRDGEAAVGQMLVGPGDLARRRALIEGDGGGAISASSGSGANGPGLSDAAQHRWGLFLELMRFAEGGSCRHDTVLRYFGDEAEILAGCGRCDVCERLGKGESEAIAEGDEEVTLTVRKALSSVARIHGRYGLSAAGGASARPGRSATAQRGAGSNAHLRRPRRSGRTVAHQIAAALRHRGLGRLRWRRPAGGGAHRNRFRGHAGRAAGSAAPAP